MRQNAPSNPTRGIVMAITAGAVVATGMMFVPAGALESLIGAAGLSGLLHVPLTDESRALIAFGTGAMTLCGLTLWLLRTSESGYGLGQVPAARRNSAVQLNTYIPRYLSAKMPKAQHEEVVGASPNFGSSEHVLELVDVAPECPVIIAEPSTANMIAQLETAVAHRHLELARLTEQMSDPSAQMSGQSSDDISNADLVEEEILESSEGRRPVLELVPQVSMKEDDADSALAAALATLHRMNAAAR